MKNLLIIAGVVVALVVLWQLGIFESRQSDLEKLTQTDFNYSLAGALTDISLFEEIRGIIAGDATGIVEAGFSEGEYRLLALLEGLPDPLGSDYYEGWIGIEGEPQPLVSTGRFEKIKNSDQEAKFDYLYVNSFSSIDNHTDLTFFFVSLEPDDGDPSQADVVLEGTLKP